MKQINQIFFKGLIVVLPITLTFYLLFWASRNIEALFSTGLRPLLGDELYTPGLGIVVAIIFIFIVGILVSNYLTASVLNWFTGFLERVPLIKAIYKPLQDLMALIPGKSSERNRPQRVVLVPFGNGSKVLGLVTREELDELPDHDLISVYVPLSYMLGGVTILTERQKVEIVDIPVDQALKLSVTAWIKAPDSE